MKRTYKMIKMSAALSWLEADELTSLLRLTRLNKEGAHDELSEDHHARTIHEGFRY